MKIYFLIFILIPSLTFSQKSEQKIIKGFGLFQLGHFTKNDLTFIKNCDSIYYSFVISKESYEIYEDENIVVLNNKSYEIVDTNSYFNISDNDRPSKYIYYLIEYFDISTNWWRNDQYGKNLHNHEDLRYIFKDIEVYHIHNYKFNDYQIHINLLFYKNLLIGIYVEHNQEWHDAFELKYPNHDNIISGISGGRPYAYQSDYQIDLSDEHTLFHNTKYTGYNGIIENKITEINKKLFLKKTKNLKGF